MIFYRAKGDGYIVLPHGNHVSILDGTLLGLHAGQMTMQVGEPDAVHAVIAKALVP